MLNSARMVSESCLFVQSVLFQQQRKGFGVFFSFEKKILEMKIWAAIGKIMAEHLENPDVLIPRWRSTSPVRECVAQLYVTHLFIALNLEGLSRMRSACKGPGNQRRMCLNGGLCLAKAGGRWTCSIEMAKKLTRRKVRLVIIF